MYTVPARTNFAVEKSLRSYIYHPFNHFFFHDPNLLYKDSLFSQALILTMRIFLRPGPMVHTILAFDPSSLISGGVLSSLRQQCSPQWPRTKLYAAGLVRAALALWESLCRVELAKRGHEVLTDANLASSARDNTNPDNANPDNAADPQSTWVRQSLVTLAPVMRQRIVEKSEDCDSHTELFLR